MDKFYKKEQVITKDGELIESRLKNYYRPFQDDRGYNFKYKSTFVKSYAEIELPFAFTDNECGKLYRLSKRIYSASNLLARRTMNRIVPMTLKEINDCVGVHRVNFKKFWDKVLEYRVVKVVVIGKEEFYCFNPLYFNSTRYMPLYVYQAFKEELRNHIPDWVAVKYKEMEMVK